MNKNFLWTKSKARLQLIKSTTGCNFHWLFLPGGFGLGSESLVPLTNILKLPGSMWHVDLPGDGSNLVDHPEYYYERWAEALIEVVSVFDEVVLVAHSSGGMFALSIKPLKKILSGLVLMGSAPNYSWQRNYSTYSKKNPLPKVERLQQLYEKHPSNALLKQLTIAAAPHFLTPSTLKKDLAFFNCLPYNMTSQLWFDKYFHPTYQAKWVPTTLPTLIFTGDQDPITPLTVFSNKKIFHRKNILMREINHASHFPWMDNSQDVINVFSGYCKNYLKI
jgi:pimeloyl-ACP methyl ester carboxylesterase